MNKKIAEVLEASRKIVIKIGSNTLAKADGTQNTDFMVSIARQCADLIKKGKKQLNFEDMNKYGVRLATWLRIRGN